MKKILLLGSILLTACGSNQKDQGDVAAVTGGVQAQPADAREVVVEYRKDGNQVAVSLEDTKDLPKCSNANSSQIAFVKSQDSYFTCGNSVWSQLVPKDSIAQAPKTAPDAPIASDAINAWNDPITGHQWLIGGITSPGMVLAFPPCSGGWQLPTTLDARAAIQHGILLAGKPLNGPGALWTREFYPPQQNTNLVFRIGVDGNGSERDETSSQLSSPGIACVKD